MIVAENFRIEFRFFNFGNLDFSWETKIQIPKIEHLNFLGEFSTGCASGKIIGIVLQRDRLKLW